MLMALDLATITGVCVGGGDEPPLLFSCDLFNYAKSMQITGVKARNEFGVGEMGLAAERLFDSLITTHKPTVIIFESPILRAVTTISTTRKTQGLALLIEMAALKHKIPIYEESVLSIKSCLSGHAHAEKKHQVAAAIAMGVEPPDDNAADAFGLWLLGLGKFNPGAYAAWKRCQNCVAWQRNLNDVISCSKMKRAKSKQR